jgi:soluble lytic murein transglycosylase-like protein
MLLTSTLPVPANANHLCDPLRVVGVSFVNLERQRRLGMTGIDADNWDSALLQLVEEPHGKHSGLEAHPHSIWRVLADKLLNFVWCRCATSSPECLTGFVDNASFGFFKRHIKTDILSHWVHCSAPSLGNQCGERSNERAPRLPHVPTTFEMAVARSGGPGRPRGRRECASPWTVASTMAALRSLGAMTCIVAMFASSILSSVVAHAELAVSAAHRANSLPVDPFAAFITEASKRFAVPEHWMRSVMRVESAGEVRARSRKGAMGLMQIMPQTWSELRARYELGTDPYDPHDNILAGAAYIRELYQRFGAPGFLAAYNSGPTRYENHLAMGRPLPDETRDYVAILAPMIGGMQVSGKMVVADSLTLARSPLFVVRSASSSSDDRLSPGVRPDRPSNARPVVDLSALVPQSGNLFVHRTGKARSQ